MPKPIIFHKYQRHRALLILYFLLILYATLPAASAWGQSWKDRVEKHILNNGITVLLLNRQFNPTVSFSIRHKVGSVDEESGRTGAAHFLEHLFFKGTESIGTIDVSKEEHIRERLFAIGQLLDDRRREGKPESDGKIQELKAQLQALADEERNSHLPGEMDRFYTENGGRDLNASTSVDFTTFHVSLPANKLELWARIESDRMTAPVFRQFYAERDVVMEERRQRIEADPRGKLYEHFLAAAFLSHPYRNPIVGWKTDISFLSPSYLKDFFRRFYRPDNTVIAVVGNIDTSETLNIIRRYFEPIPRRDELRPIITVEAPQRGEKRIEVIFDANPMMLIGYHKPNLPHPDDYVFDVIDFLLTGGRSSRLQRKLVDEMGLAESVHVMSALPGSRFPNLFTIFVSPRPPATFAQVEKAIYEELDRLKQIPLTQEELDKVKNMMKADLIRSLQSNASLAGKLSYFESLKGFEYIFDHINQIGRITTQDIMRVAEQYLHPDNRTVALLKRKN